MTNRRKSGRPPGKDPATNCCMVRFNSVEYARFLTLFELSGVQSKAVFIKARVFDDTFRVIKIDRTQLDYYQKLSALFGQFRSVGVNYNQAVAALNAHFTEQRAYIMLKKLEEMTLELAQTGREIVVLTKEFNDRQQGRYENY